MNIHGSQSYKKQLRLQDVFAGTRPSEEPCLLDGSLIMRASKTGRRGRGTGSLFNERRLVTLNVVILISGDGRRGHTLIAYNCTMEVDQEHFRERTVLSQAKVCVLGINTARLGIKRCSSFLNRSSLKQLFKQSKDDIKEEVFRRCLLSSKEEQHDLLACEGREQGLAIHISTAVLLSYKKKQQSVLTYVLVPMTWGAQRASREAAACISSLHALPWIVSVSRPAPASLVL